MESTKVVRVEAVQVKVPLLAPVTNPAIVTRAPTKPLAVLAAVFVMVYVALPPDDVVTAETAIAVNVGVVLAHFQVAAATVLVWLNVVPKVVLLRVSAPEAFPI